MARTPCVCVDPLECVCGYMRCNSDVSSASVNPKRGLGFQTLNPKRGLGFLVLASDWDVDRFALGVPLSLSVCEYFMFGSQGRGLWFRV